jgi:hypothetical protein
MLQLTGVKLGILPFPWTWRCSLQRARAFGPSLSIVRFAGGVAVRSR